MNIIFFCYFVIHWRLLNKILLIAIKNSEETKQVSRVFILLLVLRFSMVTKYIYTKYNV
jgi:hypothetical protein